MKGALYKDKSGVVLYYYKTYESDGRNSGESFGVWHKEEAYKVWDWSAYGSTGDTMVGATCLARW